jgi:nucleotide-binding universal stress UspA family protein
VALRDLLVYLDQSQGAAVRLRLAADLARRHACRLTALFVRESTVAQLHERRTAELGICSAEAMDRVNQGIQASIDEAEEGLRSALAAVGREHGLETEWRCVDGVASAVVPQHARYADLCILGQFIPTDAASVGYTFSEQLLFVTGRPVLFVPDEGSFATLGGRILVAWNSSRASARAVSDALPLIERAEQTTVVTVNPTEITRRYGALPAKHLVEHLKRHADRIEGIRIDDVPASSIADVLQAEAHKMRADLVVAGAFGHPKLWEKLLGGVTHDLLTRMNLPIMMSH